MLASFREKAVSSRKHSISPTRGLLEAAACLYRDTSHPSTRPDPELLVFDLSSKVRQQRPMRELGMKGAEEFESWSESKTGAHRYPIPIVS